MNKTTIALGAILAGGVAVTGCSSSGGGTRAPDEFRVVRKAPLTVPPDYNLRPPAPGAARPQELQPSDQARAALFGVDYGSAASEGERLLVGRAGGEAIDPTIRAQVDFDAANIVHKNEAFSDEVLSGAEPDEGEQEAIENATGGGEVMIERKRINSKLPGL